MVYCFHFLGKFLHLRIIIHVMLQCLADHLSLNFDFFRPEAEVEPHNESFLTLASLEIFIGAVLCKIFIALVF